MFLLSFWLTPCYIFKYYPEGRKIKVLKTDAGNKPPTTFNHCDEKKKRNF